MDLRVQRTKRNLINAFIKLRTTKPIEKITIRELADLAEINKATFYTHYKDIYDLSEQLENEVIASIISDIPHPEYLILHPKRGVMDLLKAILKQGSLINILFSGSRQGMLAERIESNLKSYIYDLFPEYKTELKRELLLTVLIRGSFHAYMSHREENIDEVVEILGDISECLIQNYD